MFLGLVSFLLLYTFMKKLNYRNAQTALPLSLWIYHCLANVGAGAQSQKSGWFLRFILWHVPVPASEARVCLAARGFLTLAVLLP
jgi:hypothetical protein